MNKTFKKVLCTMLSLSMIAGTIVIPAVTASADVTPLVAGDTVEQEWKFDFGAEGQTPAEGFTAVAPDRNYVTAKDYGFLGIDEEAYKLSERIDSFGMQKGQQITLAAGGTGENDGIGSTGEDAYGNACDEFYPTRFALKADDETYYRVKATVTTLDATKPANVSLYTERKHPLFTDTTLAAGETKTVLFTVRPTPIYYQKSNPQGSIADGMVNVCVLGENSALASLEIQKVSTAPVFWVLGDSTVTDGNCSLPFFKLQNYTGVGTGLTKYIPGTFAMVNEGEGGLNAADSLHFNMVSSRIKAGDYLYVEYGHNHKDDGPTGYTACLDKYYNLCHEKNAKLIIVSPIERINQWDSETSKYTHSLRGFATAGEEYVAAKVTAGARDIAYVDLNEYSLNFYNKIVSDNGDSANAIKYYFQTAKGGGTDTTHPNDAGAEALAYEFIKAAKAVTDTTQKAVLDGFLDNITEETASLLDISAIGTLAGDAWPTYIVPTDNEYPVVIRNIAFNEQGVPTSAKVTVQQAKINLSAYGIIVITIYNEDGTEKGKLYAVDQVDNSTGLGNQTITHFRGDVTLGENDTYTAIVMQAKDNAGGLVVDEEANQPYSSVYVPSEITAHFILDEDGNGGENFEFYGAAYGGETPSVLTEFNSWNIAGSAYTKTLTLGETEDFKYTTVQTDGAKENKDGTVAANQGSFILTKSFAKDEETDTVYDTGSTGRYIVSADLKYLSGGGARFKFASGVSSNNAWGSQSLQLFSVDSDGKINAAGQEVGQISAINFTPVKYILDMDLGTAEVSVAGADPVTVKLNNYDTTALTVSPTSLNTFMIEADKNAVGIQMANLVVGKLKDEKLPKKTINIMSSNDDWGTVQIVSPEQENDTTEPASLFSADIPNIELSYDSENVVVTTDGAVEFTMVAAKYDDDNKLVSLKTIPVSFEKAGYKAIKVEAGSKVMLWDSVESMEPIAEPFMAVMNSVPKTLTADLNTVVTLKAVPNEGYSFIAWKDGEGATLSTDSEYSFRLREDGNVIALFAIEPKPSDIVNFSLSANPPSIKSTVGETTTLVISDAVDSAGTKSASITNRDFTWVCTETGITISEDGVLTVGDDFSMGGALTKDILVKATINGIEKSCKITIFGYEYYENMSESSTTFDGTFMTIGGKTAIVFPGASTTKKYRMANAIALDKATTVNFDVAWSGQNTCQQSRTLNFVNSSGTTIFSMYYSWGSLYVNDGTSNVEITSAIAKDSWKTTTAVIDPVANTVTVSVAGSTVKDSTDTTVTTTLASGAGDIAGIDFVSAGSVPGPDARALGISNVTVIK